ncbi:biopolymer transporter ExbD [Pedobacter sp. Leaf194]|uniref:biopolymer transporter ExbD n=1 Tax=Pedobacter sp. Leaf194 TaxID=1736297 RepID=UPI000703AA3A|nr:biopolymer transporter ExbD [Pedobacter sp. Leaf194]KQS41220.1 hypothetical protein ASG14_01700 [Pedobacter sp. Leaf194]
MTILLGKNEQAAYYMGEMEKAMLQVCNLSELEKRVAESKLAVARAHANRPEKFMIVIIKPTKAATYKDFIDVIDEMKIADVKSYAIDDENISAKESAFMSAKGL